jgi:CheY-like chemotaxis protein
MLRSPAPGDVCDLGKLTLDHKLVLVVDDDPGLLRMIQRVLEPSYRVATADSGDNGLTQAITLQPDLIVSGNLLHGLSVSNLLEAVRQQPELSKIPFLLLLDRGDEAAVLCSCNASEDCLTKPFSVSDLRRWAANHGELKRAPSVAL